MPPMPNYAHQDLESDLEYFLKMNWARPRKAKVLHQMNLASIGGWPNDYRIPDLLLVSIERFAINRNKYFEGAPDVVIEIHSPGDDTYEKLPFYEKLAVPECWIIHRDSKEPEIYLLDRGLYRQQLPSSEGWINSPGTGIELKVGRAGKLAIRVSNDPASMRELPEE